MYTPETNYIDKLLYILECYEKSPVEYRLPRNNRDIAVYRLGSMTYVDMNSLFNIVDEILGPQVPHEIVEYLKSISYIETIGAIKEGIEVALEVICTQFIDKDLFTRCKSWIDSRQNKSLDEDHLFQKINLNSAVQKNEPSPFKIHSGDKHCESLADMFPFEETWSTSTNLEGMINTEQEQADTSYYERDDLQLNKRPRGKQMEVHSEPLEDRPFVCGFKKCKRAFKRFEHLKRHTKMHTGERPYKCRYPGCQRAFSRSDNLGAHYKTHNILNKRTGTQFDVYEKDFETY